MIHLVKKLHPQASSLFQSNLAALIRRKNLSVSQLSANTKIPTATLYRLLNDNKSNPTLSSLRPLAQFFNISVSQLIGDEVLDIEVLNKAYQQNQAHWQSVPLLESLDDVQAWLCENINQEQPDFIRTDIGVSDRAFALIMKNSSTPSAFPEGSALIFDPRLPVHDRSYVLVHLHNHKKTVFKQIIFDMPFRFLQSISLELSNKHFVKLTKEDEILAVLAQSKINFTA